LKFFGAWLLGFAAFAAVEQIPKRICDSSGGPYLSRLMPKAISRSKTKKAKSPKAKRQWSKVANKVLAETGDDARAIRSANAAVARRGYAFRR